MGCMRGSDLWSAEDLSKDDLPSSFLSLFTAVTCYESTTEYASSRYWGFRIQGPLSNLNLRCLGDSGHGYTCALNHLGLSRLVTRSRVEAMPDLSRRSCLFAVAQVVELLQTNTGQASFHID